MNDQLEAYRYLLSTWAKSQTKHKAIKDKTNIKVYTLTKKMAMVSS